MYGIWCTISVIRTAADNALELDYRSERRGSGRLTNRVAYSVRASSIGKAGIIPVGTSQQRTPFPDFGPYLTMLWQDTQHLFILKSTSFLSK